MADSGSQQEPRFFRTLQKDLHVVWEEVGRVGVRQTVRRSFTDLQEFYLTTQRRDRLAGMGRVKRTLSLAFWLLKALFLKLTPARRLLLLVSFWFMWQGSFQFTSGNTRITFDFPFFGIALLLLILMLELKDKLLARNELEAGRAVQLALMPDRAPSLPGWDIWLYTRSANDVGGDLVDYLQIDPQRLAVALGDVAGKALPAALLMAKLQATIRALASQCDTLDDLGRRVNHILNRDGLPNRFATLVYLELAPGNGHVRLLIAGHMPPLLLRAGTLEELPRGSIALGITPDADFTEQHVDLQPGEIMLVYSDGVTEAQNRGGDFFGDDRLRATLAAAGALTAERAGRSVLAAVDAFTGDAPVFDDLSLIVLKRLA
ncbi:MAG TPA: PP2C family protein-serine/threonine phosphatase [Vicinamibacterales bacterium]|nr:PP2C family protein-serine/threonine phosphatase [Vicinamibacterales bacterium]